MARPKNTPTPRFVTLAELAKLTGFSRRTIYEWKDAGKLPVRRTPGAEYRFDLNRLDEFFPETEVRR